MAKEGVLSDKDINQERSVYERDVEGYGLGIEPFNAENVQPASYDLTLGSEWIVPVEEHPDDRVVKLEDGLSEASKRRFSQDKFIIGSMQNPDYGGDDVRPFVLGHVQESIDLPPYITAEVKGRSSVGRLGVIPHTAGWGDPGFEGQLTLEFVNLSPNPIELTEGSRIAQVVFSYTNTPAGNPYGEKENSKYQGQTGVTESRIEEDNE